MWLSCINHRTAPCGLRCVMSISDFLHQLVRLLHHEPSWHSYRIEGLLLQQEDGDIAEAYLAPVDWLSDREQTHGTAVVVSQQTGHGSRTARMFHSIEQSHTSPSASGERAASMRRASCALWRCSAAPQLSPMHADSACFITQSIGQLDASPQTGHKQPPDSPASILIWRFDSTHACM